MNENKLVTAANTPLSKVETVLQKYLKEVALPTEKRSPQILVCPVGLIGAGKTTIMKPLSNALDLVRISTDRVRILLREAGEDEDLVQKEGIALLKNLLQQGYSVGVDADCSAHKDILEKIASENGAHSIWIHVNPPREFIVQKLGNLEQLGHDHPKAFKNSKEALEAFNQHLPVREKNFATVDFPFIYAFDTSKVDTLEEQVDEAAKVITASIH